MSATPELTTRDVLQQVDRRLTHLEELHLQHEESNDRAHAGLDAKIDGLRTGVDTKFDGLDVKIDGLRTDIDTKIDGLRTGFDAKIDSLDTKIDGLRTGVDTKIDGLEVKIDGFRTGVDTKIDRNLRWTVGLIVGSWMSTMSAILLK